MRSLHRPSWKLRLADRLDPPQNPLQHQPLLWVETRLDEFLTVDQGEILELVRDNRYTAVQSCHDVGKSFTSARAAAWWIDTHPAGEAFVVTTAPTSAQVRSILWREMAHAWRAGKLPGRITEAAEWKLDMGYGPSELVAIGRKPADYDPGAFQGIHALYVLVIIDEACGVPEAIFNAVDALATNEYARVLAVGNPDDPASHFAKICKPGSGWKVKRIDALRSPNFTRDEVAKYPPLQAYMIQEGILPSTEPVPDKIRPLLVSPIWVNERILRWGVNSPMFTSKVRGLFPLISIDTLIEPHWVTQAQARELTPVDTDLRMGVDVARYGNDHSIIGLRRGGVYRKLVDIAKGPVTQLAGRVQEIGWEEGRWPWTPTANVDDDGVGGGVTDILLENGYPTLPLMAGAACSSWLVLPNGKPRFVNARSEWWWNAKEALAGPSGTGEDGWIDLDPGDDELADQLTKVRYRVNRHGQIEVESKESMRSRRLPSPDDADAFVMSLVSGPPISHVEWQRMITGDVMSRQW